MSRHPECPFCIENGKVEVLRQTENAYVCQVMKDERPVPGQYFIIPKKHYLTPFALPATFQYDRKQLLDWLVRQDLIKDLAFNLTTNCGHDAGQRLLHLHEWVIDRTATGRPSDGIGLSGLRDRVDEQAGEIAQLRDDLAAAQTRGDELDHAFTLANRS